ncbi:MAG: diguanylate cyclase [Solirubrobacteraceae bacterium]|nr:diguanylate cyclase [Solirubrobacteraceae bacterium]
MAAAIEPRSALSGPEATIAPFGVVAMLGLAFLAGQALLGELRPVQAAIAGVTIAGSLAAVLHAFARLRGTPSHKAPDPRIHAASALLVLGLFVAGAAAGRGLASPYLTALVPGATYLGLVLPKRLSALVVGLLTLSLVPLAFVGPPVTWLEALTLITLVPGGRYFGVLCGSAHRRAERVARQLTRADRLTRTLSRAGFIEELEHALVQLRRAKAPVALFLIDLDGFKEINTARGGAAGDELLEWSGQRLAEVLPRGASAGRLGGDEFGVATVGMDRLEADRFAVALRDAIGERHPVSIGVATSEDSTVTVSDLLRVGNASLQRAKDDGERRIHGLVAGGLRPDRSASAPAPPVLTYERLRRNGGRPRQPSPNVLFGKFLSLSIGALGLIGGLLALGIVVTGFGGDSLWRGVLTALWVPWVLGCLVAAYSARHIDPTNDRDVMRLIVAATLLVGGGIGVAALAQGGGVLEPVIAGLSLRVLFDTSVAFRRQALVTLAGTLAFYLAVVVFGPSSSLWAAPFHLVLIGSAFLLGRVAHHGFAATTEQWLTVARTDVLTGLSNRLGVEGEVAIVLEEAARTGQHVAILSMDIDGMRAFNDHHGHAAGDAAIQRVARALGDTFSSALATGRLGADEFVTAVPVLSPSDADRLTATIETVLRPELDVSAGVAVFPSHGRDLDGLLHIADVRRRAAKAARRDAAERAATPRSRPAA